MHCPLIALPLAGSMLAAFAPAQHTLTLPLGYDSIEGSTSTHLFWRESGQRWHWVYAVLLLTTSRRSPSGYPDIECPELRRGSKGDGEGRERRGRVGAGEMLEHFAGKETPVMRGKAILAPVVETFCKIAGRELPKVEEGK